MTAIKEVSAKTEFDRHILDYQIIERAAEYLLELELAFFEVVLCPAPDQRHSGHCIRVVQYANPQWYSELCAENVSCRGKGRKRMKRARTFIKKEHCLNGLRKVAAGIFTGTYPERLVEFIGRKIKNENTPKAGSVYYSDIPF